LAKGNPEASDYEIGNVIMKSFMINNIYDIFLGFYEHEKRFDKLDIEQSNSLDYQVLFSQGKFQQAFRKYSDRFYSNYYPNAAFLYEKNFQPFTNEMADSVIYSLSRNARFSIDWKWDRTRSSLYYLIAEDEIGFHDALSFVEKVRSEVQKKLSSRFEGNNSNAKVYLDSLFLNLMYMHNYTSAVGRYGTLKFLEGEIAIEEGDYETARRIFENLEQCQFLNDFMYAPIKFRLGYIYDKVGEEQKSYDYYKYFVTIYEDCDPFYQGNVKYATDRIAEYEKGN